MPGPKTTVTLLRLNKMPEFTQRLVKQEQLRADKNCKKPGCYGRGYTGFVLKNGKRTPIACSCLRVLDVRVVDDKEAA